MNINTKRLEQYRETFFQGNWLDELREKGDWHTLFERVNLLLEGKVIFNDALDMEACHIPYPLTPQSWHWYPKNDPEWTFMLARHGFLVDLAQAYVLTQDDRYVTQLKHYLFDFIRSSQPDNDDCLLAWRELDTGIRLTNWIRVLTYIDIAEHFSQDECDCLLSAIQLHIAYLKKHYIPKYDLSNWGVLSIIGILVVDVFFEELVPDTIKKWAWERLEIQWRIQFDSSGLHWEQSPMYHHEVVYSTAYLYQIINYLGIDAPIDLTKAIQKAAEASYYYANPHDKLNALHDSDSVDFSMVYDVYRALGFLKDGRNPQQQVALLVGNYTVDMTNKTMPEFFHSIESGFSALKLPKAYVTLFNGWHGSGHGHAALGHMTLSYGVDDFFISTGRFTYENTDIRRRLKSEMWHNTVYLPKHPSTLISGTWEYEQLATPITHQVHQLAGITTWKLVWQGQYSQSQETYLLKRYVLYLSTIDTWLIIDTYLGRAGEEIEASFYLDETIIPKSLSSHHSVLQGREETLFVWMSEPFDSEVTDYAPIYNQLRPTHRLVRKTLAQQSPTCSVTVLSPTNKKIQLLPLFQNRQSTPYTNGMGIEIVDEHSQHATRIYHICSDIMTGDKLCHTHLQEPFYGELVVFDDMMGYQRIL